MADATIIGNSAQSSVIPRQLHAGAIPFHFVYSLSRTLSASDKIYMGKLPDGAKVLAMDIQFNMNPFAAAGVICVGTPADHDKFIVSVTPSAGLKFSINSPDGLGATLDTSDDATQRFTYIQVDVTTAKTGTKSGAITVAGFYTMDA